MKNRRSLYQCLHAKVMGDKIQCAKRHRLNSINLIGDIDVLRLKRGAPLEFTVCQECKDYEHMGNPVLKEDRGWK